jgi:hypothetical protein
MDMNLDLDEADMAAVRRKAEQEGRTLEEVAKTAINEYLSGRLDHLRTAIDRVRTDDAALLDRLGE